MRKSSCLLFLILSAAIISSAQQSGTPDPCGFPDTASLEFRAAALGNWGYGYDTLLYEVGVWKKSSFVRIDSVGATVQNRTMFVLTIQDTTSDSLNLRKRIWIHARTHPSEVQGTWVANEMIRMLLDTNDLAQRLRKRYVFNIMPMVNPDGVELGKPRENANGIDIESNWNTASPQKEVVVLRSQFQKYTAQPNPMRVMLNLHSAVACKRYFVFHAAGGTSMVYSLLEQRFINYVRAHFPNAIEPYTYFVSWNSAPAAQYPESWCWSNHKEKIMALTYEDGNCAAAGKFDSTARAILKGIDNYIQDTTAVTFVMAAKSIPEQYILEQNFPNPFNPSTVITYHLPLQSHVSLKVYDMLGREAAVLVNEGQAPGKHSVTFNASSLSSGVYFYRLTTNGYHETKKMQFIR